MKSQIAVTIISFICWCALVCPANAQIEISGKIFDQQTGALIPFCNVSNATSSTGTASNELGEFVIFVETLPTKLVFSHLGYAHFEIEVTGSEDLAIKLSPLINLLEEVTVTASVNDKYALELAEKAFEKANGPSFRSKYGKAFYRQKSKNGNDYSEFSEIIYDIRYDAKGIEDWDILEGRYALKKGGVHNKNYTLLSRLLTPLQPATDDLIFPLHPDMAAYYDLKLIGNIVSGEDKIAIIWFKPKPNSRVPIFEGEVYINVKTYDILKVEGKMSRDDLKLVQLMDKNSSWKNYFISYEIAYRFAGEQNSVLDYIKVDNGFDYYKNDSLIFHSSATSNLTFFEHYNPTSRKKLGGQFRGSSSDWKNLDEIGYNKQFWEENPIVKRTPVEKEVIDAFESDQAFGSIFLNSNDQVELIQSDIAGDPFVKELGASINLYNNYKPVEKIYLQTDNSIFTAGENLWYSGYAVLGSDHIFSEASGVLYVDLIDQNNEIVISQTQALLFGKATGSIQLPANLSEGNYQLRGYTDWMRNFDHDHFFYKTIKVLNPKKSAPNTKSSEERFDLQFFPEGGHTVVGLIGLVAFKAIGSDGLAREISGRITDSKGKFIASLNTLTRGSGFFYLKPEMNEQYKAILKDGTSYAIPTLMDKGYALTVSNFNPKSIKVKIQATAGLKDDSFYIIGQVRNKKIYQGKFEFGKKSTVDFEIPKRKIPSGVLTLTLLDANKKPWCERTLFVNNQDELVISTKISPAQFGRRDEIVVDVEVLDTDGRPVPTELSMAVTDLDQITKGSNSGNILTHLLLQSDIKGHIDNPGLLFADQERTTVHTLDLVMLTHGWRKFPWQETEKKSNAPKEFSFSKGLTLTGVAKNATSKPLKNASLNIVAKTKEEIGMLSANTSFDGTFSIPDFNFRGPTELVFNAFSADERPVDVRVTLDSIKTTTPEPQFKSPIFKAAEEDENYSVIADTRRRSDSLFHFNNATKLDEVVVTEKKIEKSRNETPSVYGQAPDATIYAEDNKSAHTVLNLVSMLPSVSVMGSTVSIRNGGTPLWILNGIPVNNENPSASSQARAIQKAAAASKSGGGNSSGGDASVTNMSLSIEASITAQPVPKYIEFMDTFTVERIELLRGPSAAMYGSRGANGVILIYTRKGGGTKLKPVLSPDFTIMGHAEEREFYSPKYDVKLDEHNVLDYRATLFWNPSFTTDQNGKAKLKFFNSDNAVRLQIAIEGLSIYGTPGVYLGTFGSK